MGEVVALPDGVQAGSPGHLLTLLRAGSASTRPQLAAITGLARSTVAQRVDALLATGLVIEDGATASTGGRPATRLRFRPDAGLVLVGDLGATHARVGVTDLAGAVLAEVAEDVDIAAGPGAVLDWLGAHFADLLSSIGRSADEVRGVGIGVPGPVEHDSGRPVSPPIMPGWDAYPIPEHFAERFPGAPVLVDNDVNIMALGEYWTSFRRSVDDLLFIKVGTGIGCGIVASGRIHRGAQGAAGDLGHVQVPGYEDAVCRCGNVACVEAIAGGQALADRLRAAGHDTRNARAVVELVAAGDRDAIRMVRDAGRTLGHVLAAAVNFFNPAVIVIGGDVANAHEPLLAGIREVVYQRSLPLATRHLRVVHSQLGDGAGIRGASAMVVEHLLAPATVDELVTTAAADRAAN
ncbi:ROK family protein [Egicoccus sp. AB-alg6-2]|uniref:ROK family transcriptional regulator n=1 Tax=Egicoccus sp. AB-alg6-2 TaxID=3242692 RepID=UPI00359DAD6D